MTTCLEVVLKCNCVCTAIYDLHSSTRRLRSYNGPADLAVFYLALLMVAGDVGLQAGVKQMEESITIQHCTNWVMLFKEKHSHASNLTSVLRSTH